ncbi:hypothetical protein ACNVED_11760 [Legionella sp. D16C41]|uniref:hypothetical protein n=1 Tax=Legionella sp. D16C41 TaxID=3402688 RepID=UPI003AF87A49
MPIILQKINETSIQRNHRAWFDYYLPQLPANLGDFKDKFTTFLQTLNDEQFSILNYPEFWSGERLFQTKIQISLANNVPAAFQEINKWIDAQKKRYSNEPDKLAALENLIKNYRKYFTILKRKVLIASIKDLVASLNFPADIGDESLNSEELAFQKSINQLLSDSSLLSMQTRYDCLQSHLKLTIVCQQTRDRLIKQAESDLSWFWNYFNKVRNILTQIVWPTKILIQQDKSAAGFSNLACEDEEKAGDLLPESLKLVKKEKEENLAKRREFLIKEAEKIKIIEVLAKRLVDDYYRDAKKVTFSDAVQKDVATIASTFSIIIGLTAAVLGIAAFFFPPLAIPALILGSIGFISYLATILSTIKIAEEGLIYKRPPKLSELLWLALDIVLFPLNFVSGQLFSLIGKGFNWSSSIIKILTDVWDNVLSNILPDIFSAKETFKDTATIGTRYTKTGELRNTKATSFSLLRSMLVTTNEQGNDNIELFEKVANTKKYLAGQLGYRPIETIEERENTERRLKDLATSQIESYLNLNKIAAIKQRIDSYITFRTILSAKIEGNQLIDISQYTKEITQTNYYLYSISKLCEDYLIKNFDRQFLSKSNKPKQIEIDRILEIHQLTRKLIQLNYQDLKSFQTELALPKTLQRHQRGFVYTSLEPVAGDEAGQKNKTLPIFLSHHADILFWAQGFRGLRTSAEAKAIIETFEEYKLLSPDAKTRFAKLKNLEKKCQTYLSNYGSEESKQKKGRYQYVQKLYDLVIEEIKILERPNLNHPILVGYKAR